MQAGNPGRRAGKGASPSGRSEAAVQRRLRISLALIEMIGEKGYRATTVADVIAHAGVSRKAFYEQFSNKQDCLLVTFDMVAAEVLRRVGIAYRAADGWPGRVEAAISALLESAIENPAALRLSLLEVSAVGPAGIARRESSLRRYEAFIREALELAPGEGEVSDTVLTAIVGGLHRVLYRRVLAGGDPDPTALIPDLVAWMVSYYPTPAPLLALPRPVSATHPDTLGGRAPGTLAPLALLSRRRGLARGEHNVSRNFVVHNQRERILDAVANLTAAEGYAELKVERIAERAAVSLNAFYELFAGKEDAFLVAYEVGHGRLLAIVEAAYAAESDWRLGVKAGLGALMRFLAGEPSFARMALIDAQIASPRTADRSAAGVDSLARMLVPSASDAVRPATLEVTVHAITAGIFELCLHHALQNRTGELVSLIPLATYIALTPFVGATEATKIARDAPRR